MKIKTSELTGAALDWAVRYAENGKKPVDYAPNRDNFSTCWNKGGPIIERERIGILSSGNAYYQRDGGTFYYYGPTPLIAAMRCFCASKLGDEVEVPDELV